MKVSSFEAIEIVLKEYFNLSYSEIARTKKNVAKLDQIGVPGYERGGLENWGLIMYGPDYFNPDDQTEEEKFQQVVLMSHEIGHHWIGNLVTMKWWNDLWINEAGLKFKIIQKLSRSCPRFWYKNPQKGTMVFFAYLSLSSTRPDWIWQNDFFVYEYLTTSESCNYLHT